MIDDRISDNKRGGISAGMVFGAFILLGVIMISPQNSGSDWFLNWYGIAVIVSITGGACIWLNKWDTMSEVVQPFVGEMQWKWDEESGRGWVCTDSKKWVQWTVVWIWTLWLAGGLVLATLAHNSELFSESPSILFQVHLVFRGGGLHPIWRLFLAYEAMILVSAILTIWVWWINK